MMRGVSRRRAGPMGPAVAVAVAALMGGCSDETAEPPALALHPPEVHFALGDSVETLEVRNGGAGSLTWELQDDAPWLAVDPAAGTTSEQTLVSLRVVPDSLPNGPHVATVTVTSNGGNSVARVRMWPALAVEPDTLRLVAGEAPGEIRLANHLVGFPLAWSAGSSAEWLPVSPAAGTLAETSDTLDVMIDRSAVTPGMYSGLVWVAAGAHGADTVRVEVTVPQTAAVTGRVYYQGTYIPTSGVRVSIGARADTTGTEGWFTLVDVPLGARTLVAEREGFATVQTAVTVTTEGAHKDVAITSETYTYSVSGTLTNALGAGLVYASVHLLNPDDTVSSISTSTRAGGLYTLERVPPGARRLRFKALHYQAQIDDVEVPGTGGGHDARVVAEPVQPPAPFSGPMVARLDCGRVRVSWTPGILAGLETVAGYRVERAAAAGGPYEDAGGLVPGAATDHYDDGGWSGATVHYRVRTETIDGDGGDPTMATAFAPAPWVQLSPAALYNEVPEERWGQAAVCDPHAGRPRMLILGGTGCESGTCGIDFGDVWALDLTDLLWELLDPGTGPADRNEHTAVLDGARNRVIVFGGKLSEGERIYADTWAFDLGSSTWVPLHAGPGAGTDAAPAARYGHVAVLDAAGERMLIHGGQAGETLNDVWSFDLAAHTWTRLRTGAIGEQDPQPEARHDHVAVYDPVAQRMIVHGGLRGGAVNSTLSDTWAFELQGATWVRLANGPQRCRHMIDYDALTHRGILAGGWTYAGGGQASGRFNDIWALDLTTDVWHELDGGEQAARPERRDRHSMVVRPGDGALYIFGGLLEVSGLGADTWTFCAGER